MLKLLKALWQDDRGGVVCGEYAVLSVAVFATALSGTSYTKDKLVQAYQGLGDSLAQATQPYTAPQQPLTAPAPTCLVLCGGQTQLQGQPYVNP